MMSTSKQEIKQLFTETYLSRITDMIHLSINLIVYLKFIILILYKYNSAFLAILLLFYTLHKV